ncbi:EAL domain-containing protein [Egicoccus sp. AB-alg2]|uniref:EAL domain-containing protein n=1 Tax=Egicoccus sp. AB-alg2 TaxID=3242693 RepID=UPI00359E8736
MRGGTVHGRREAPVPRELRAAVQATLLTWQGDRPAEHAPEAARLAQLLAGEGLSVVYQPVVELASARPVAVEATVRADGTDLDPTAVAERYGLATAVAAETLVRACTQLATWRRASTLAGLRLHLDVSSSALASPVFVDLVRRVLAATALPAGALVVEVSEHTAFDAEGAAPLPLYALADLGIGIALDAFGTGMTTVDRLASAPVTMLKLDRGFVSAVGTATGPTRGRALVVQAAIGLGGSLGLEVVADGIDRPEQIATLREWGCELGQGVLFAAPADAETTHTRVAAGRVEPPRREQPLVGPRALDLAAAAAAVVVAGDPRAGSLRADTVEAARVVGAALSLSRTQIDVVVLLATLVGAGELLQVVRTAHAVPAWRELEAHLSQAPVLRADAHPGALAAAVARLAVARRVRRDLGEALRELAPDDADLAADLAGRLRTWWYCTAVSSAPVPAVREVEQRLRGRDDAGERLRGLVGVARAIGASGELLDVLEICADEALSALGGLSLSISRWDREGAALRTLVNVGELRGDAERRPRDEHYLLRDLPVTSRLLLERSVILRAADDPAIDADERDRLRRAGLGSAAGVAIVVEGAVWGELYVTTSAAEPSFSAADVPYLTAVAGFVGLAISRAEHYGHLSRLAGEDPLTRLANRRPLEDFAAALLVAGPAQPVTAIMLDVNGLKEINDVHGHAAGDDLLVTVGDALSRVSLTHAESLAARLGGDEFCVVLAGGAEEAMALVARFTELLADSPPPQPQVAIGVATAGPADTTLTDLLARADVAQYRAKATGLAVVVDDGSGSPPPPSRLAHAAETAAGGRRARSRGHRRSLEAALGRWSRAVDDADDAPTRLEQVGAVAVAMFDLNRWVLSVAKPGNDVLATHSRHVRRRRVGEPLKPMAEDGEYPITEYPTTAEAFRNGGGFAVDADDPRADPQERAVLAEEGFDWVVGIAETTPDGSRWLLECYGDDESAPLPDVVPVIEALASRTLGRGIRCAS